MASFEFLANVEDGKIEIPLAYRERITGLVRVTVVVEQRQEVLRTLIDELLENPIRLKDFQPLSRDQVYELSNES